VISKEKLALIHVGKKQLDLSDPEYREILRHHGGVASAADLDDEGFKRVVDCMKALGFWVKRAWEPSRARDPGALPTVGQLRVIKHLWDDLSEYVPEADQAAYQRGFYAKALKLPTLGPQTRAQANTVIEVLKQRVQREMRRAYRTTAEEPPTP